MENLDTTIKIMQISLSFETDEKGNITSINHNTNNTPTRKVIIEKYMLKYVEIEVLGRIVSGVQSVYEEPHTVGDFDDEIKKA